MKNFKYIALIIGILFLAGCATSGEDPGLKPYQGKPAAQIFNQATTELNKKDYEKAAASYSALDALYPFGKYSQQGQLNIIYAYYKDSDYDSAVAAADRYIHLYPRGVGVDYAYYLKGLSYFDKSKTWFSKIYPINPSVRDLTSYKAAFTTFDELVSYYPKSKYAGNARARMLYIRDIMARHELEVAKFYMKHEEYVAAANRAGTVVAHFEGTKYVPDALKIMIKAYRETGATEQANAAIRVLKLNYPNVSV